MIKINPNSFSIGNPSPVLLARARDFSNLGGSAQEKMVKHLLENEVRQFATAVGNTVILLAEQPLGFVYPTAETPEEQKRAEVALVSEVLRRVAKKHLAKQLEERAETVAVQQEAEVAVEVKHGEKLTVAMPNYRGVMQDHEFQFGTVISYALANGEDPYFWIERERRNGGPLHFAFNVGVTIAAHAQELPEKRRARLGGLVKLEGVLFRLKEAPNQNLELVRVD